MLYAGDVAVAVLTRVASFASGVAELLVVVVVVVGAVAVGCSSNISAGGVVVVPLVFAFEADALDAVITAFTAAMLAFRFNVFSCHFFFWLHFPWPGPGMSSGGG